MWILTRNRGFAYNSLKKKSILYFPPNDLLESRQNKEGVDQWMVTWTSSHKVRVLFPNIGRSLV
jgi:hypothetical protein